MFIFQVQSSNEKQATGQNLKVNQMYPIDYLKLRDFIKSDVSPLVPKDNETMKAFVAKPNKLVEQVLEYAASLGIIEKGNGWTDPATLDKIMGDEKAMAAIKMMIMVAGVRGVPHMKHTFSKFKSADDIILASRPNEDGSCLIAQSMVRYLTNSGGDFLPEQKLKQITNANQKWWTDNLAKIGDHIDVSAAPTVKTQGQPPVSGEQGAVAQEEKTADKSTFKLPIYVANAMSFDKGLLYKNMGDPRDKNQYYKNEKGIYQIYDRTAFLKQMKANRQQSAGPEPQLIAQNTEQANGGTPQQSRENIQILGLDRKKNASLNIETEKLTIKQRQQQKLESKNYEQEAKYADPTFTKEESMLAAKEQQAQEEPKYDSKRNTMVKEYLTKTLTEKEREKLQTQSQEEPAIAQQERDKSTIARMEGKKNAYIPMQTEKVTLKPRQTPTTSFKARPEEAETEAENPKFSPPPETSERAAVVGGVSGSVSTAIQVEEKKKPISAPAEDKAREPIAASNQTIIKEKKEEKPAKVKEEKPAKVKEEKPAKVKKEKVAKVKAEKPEKVKEEKPEKVKKEKVAKVKEEKPEKVKEEKPAKVKKPKKVKATQEEATEKTEAAQISTGVAWFDKQFSSGAPEYYSKLSTDEKRKVNEEVKNFLSDPALEKPRKAVEAMYDNEADRARIYLERAIEKVTGRSL